MTVAFSNCWSDVIRSNWATCQLFIDLRTGSYQDLSDNLRAVTLTSGAVAPSPQYPTRTNGRGLDLGGALSAVGYLSVASAAALNLSPNGTILLFMRTERQYYANYRLIWKRDAGVSCAYDMFDASGTGALDIYDGATIHVLGTLAWPSVRSVGASFAVGSAPWGYQNGVQLTPPATVWAPSADASSLIIGNATGGAYGVPNVAWLSVLLFSTRLTGEEMSQIHNDFMASPFAL